MSVLRKFLCVTGLGLTLSACSLYKQETVERLCADDNGEFYPCVDMSLTTQVDAADPLTFKSGSHFKILNNYTQQMAMEISSSLQKSAIKGSVSVASFVYHDATLRKTNQLGNDLAEYFMHDLQKFGVPVSEHQLASNFEINDQGDFILSRQQSDVFKGSEIAYVLTGTMMKVNNGIMINARVIDLSNKNIVASSAKVIPPLLAQGLF